jgi:hypothetical protein
MKTYATFDEYFADQAPRNKNVIRVLRRFVKRVAPRLQESVKCGNGCWIKGDAPVAYVHCEDDHVQFGFFGGCALKDPKGLLNGQGEFARHIKVGSAPTSMRRFRRSREASGTIKRRREIGGPAASTSSLFVYDTSFSPRRRRPINYSALAREIVGPTRMS